MSMTEPLGLSARREGPITATDRLATTSGAPFTNMRTTSSPDSFCQAWKVAMYFVAESNGISARRGWRARAGGRLDAALGGQRHERALRRIADQLVAPNHGIAAQGHGSR